VPHDALMAEAAVAELQSRIRDAAQAQRAVRIRGGGTKEFYGRRVDGETVDTRAVRGIVDYEPTELVMTARGGTPLDEIDAALAAAGQMLACEPPRFAPGTTLGGAVAAGLSGPRRPYAGAVRDFVLGVRVVDGTGEALRFGGRVMKNVAGFDVARLMTGSLGTLGIITEVSLRCVPRPAVEATCVLDCSADESIRLVNEWGGKPLPVSATCWTKGRLWTRLSGAEPAVAAARAIIGGEVAPESSALWDGVRDHTHPFLAAALASSAPLWRLSVRSTTPFTDLGGDQLIEWGGALRWLVADAGTDAERVRAWARTHGGHATSFRGQDAPMFQPLPPALLALHQRLKHSLDPLGILNRGRMYAEL
jgi:glycolate oxidase FAD binding subunit